MSDTPDNGDPAERYRSALADGPRARRARDLRVYGPPRRHTNLIWLAIAVACAVLFVVLIRGVFEKSKWTAGPSTAPAVAPPGGSPADEAGHRAAAG